MTNLDALQKTDSLTDAVAKTLTKRAQQIAATATNQASLLTQICRLLAQSVPYYNWVGFYLVDPNQPDELVLGPYVGAPTEHVRIPFGKGICGRCAATKATVLVQDVTKESNYLACSLETRSEIVIPIFSGEKMVGQIDIDSHFLNPFSEVDQQFLETLCRLIGQRWENNTP